MGATSLIGQTLGAGDMSGKVSAHTSTVMLAASCPMLLVFFLGEEVQLALIYGATEQFGSDMQPIISAVGRRGTGGPGSWWA